MRYKNCHIIWVNYFDKNLSRKEGRRLSKNKAVQKPSLDELIDIVRSLGYNIIDRKNARYPSSWWIKSGYIVIDKKNISDNENKKLIIDKIAKEWRRRRGG